MKFGFFDNQLIGVDELNEITRSMIGEGISFKNSANENGEVATTVSELNKFYEKVFSSGVVPEEDTSLLVSVNGTTITVVPGTAYFANGTFITVTEDETLARISEAVNYVYAVSDMDKGEAYIEVFTESKENDANGGMYYVPLAEIASDGTVTDKRMYARSSIAAAPPENASGNYFYDLDLSKGDTTYGLPDGTQKQLHIKVNPKDYKYLQLKWDNGEDSRGFLQYEIKDGECDLLMSVGSRQLSYAAVWDNKPIICSETGDWKSYWEISFEKVDATGITMLFTLDRPSSNYYKSLKFNLSLIRKENISDETTVAIE